MPERDYLTMTDVMEQTNDGALIHIGREFTRELTFGEEVPYTEATDLTRDVGVFETPYKQGQLTQLTDLDSPVKAKKAGYYKREDIMGMQEAWCKVNKKTYDAHPSGAQLRTRMVNRMLRNMGWDWEFLLMNGSIVNDPRGFNGLLPRLGKLTDLDSFLVTDKTVKAPFVCLDGGGGTVQSDGSLSSMVFVYFDEDEGVTQIYPRGTGQKGIKHTSYGFQWQSSDEGEIVQASDQAIMTGGLAIKNARSVARIANINPQDYENLKGTVNVMIDAFRNFKLSQRSSVKIYTTSAVIAGFRKYFNNRIAPATYADAKPKNVIGDINFDGYTLRECASMLDSEGIIA